MASDSEQSIAALMTCYNRRDTTLECLKRLFAARLPEDMKIQVHLVDDGCSDGTGDAVRATYPQVHVIQGDGTLFWVQGMRLAWAHAAETDPEFYLWLNDDAMLNDDALDTLVNTYDQVCAQRNDREEYTLDMESDAVATDTQCAVIVVGSCLDPATGRRAYGGNNRVGRHPAQLTPVFPGDEPVRCDTFQGNLVLVPREVYRRIGMMLAFRHAFGDTDYGLRAVRAGCINVVAPGYPAVCEFNRKEHLTCLSHRPFSYRLRMLRKRLPLGDWFRFLWEHGDWRSLFYWPAPYIRVLLNLKIPATFSGRHGASCEVNNNSISGE